MDSPSNILKHKLDESETNKLKKIKLSDNKKPSKKLDELPEEILIEIFKYLTFKNRLKLSETCKRFFDNTSNSQFINKFHLKLEDKAMIEGLREYQKVSVNKFFIFFEPLIGRIGESVTELELKNGFLRSSTAVKIIKNCSNLKKLKIDCDEPKEDKSEELEISLESFKFNSWMSFLQTFRKVQTKEFEFMVHSCMDAGNWRRDSQMESIVEFLINQNDLKVLVLKRDLRESLIIPSFSYDRRLLDVKFRLEHLKIYDTHYSPNSAIFDFVKLHKDFLKSISVNQRTREFLKTVSDFPNLKKVQLNHVKSLTGVIMKHVEELEIDSCKNVFEAFPNLKKLQVESECSALKEIEILTKLEEIEIRYTIYQLKFLTLPKSVKKISILVEPFSNQPFRICEHQIEELNVRWFNGNMWAEKIDWIWRLLFHAQKKVKINLEGILISLKVQKALKEFEDKVQELKIKNCTFEVNLNNIEVEFSDDDETDYESDSMTESDDENFVEPTHGDYIRIYNANSDDSEED